MHTTQSDSYSADIDLQLRIGEEVISVSQTGPDWLILREPRRFDSVPAELLVTVGNELMTYPIVVSSGEEPAKRISYW